MDTAKITAFVAAADAGSLSRGAARIGARLSTMSRRIGDLEAELATKLLVRTGRGVRVTPLGERFLVRARVVLAELEAAAADVREARDAPIARLRISVPPDIGFVVMPLVLAELSRRYPDLTIESRSDVRRVSIVEEAYDAAIRLGPLDDSGLVPRSLGSFSRTPCAVPDVAASLRTLRSLAAAEHVRVGEAHDEVAGTYRGRPVWLPTRGRLRVGSFHEAGLIAASSERIAILPTFTAAPFLAEGRLARVLPRLTFPRVEARLVLTPRHRGNAAIRAFGELVKDALARAEGLVASDRPRPKPARRAR